MSAHGIVADHTDADVVAFGIETPMFQREHRKYPIAAADAGNANGFVFEISGLSDIGSRDNGAGQFVHQTGDESEIEPASHRA